MLSFEQFSGFDWDDSNIKKNWKKHKVSYLECEQIFFNQPLLVFSDAEHSDQEERHADFFRFALKQGYFFSHEVGDFYSDEIGTKARGNMVGRWSRDGWIYSTGEISGIVPKSRKYYFNPDIIPALKNFLGL